MKRYAAGILALVLALLVGCMQPARRSGGSQRVEQGSAPEQSVIPSSGNSQEAESKPPLVSTAMQEITFGDVVVTEKWEISIQSVNFEPYKDGNVWFNVYLTVKNLQRSAEDPFGMFDPIIDLELDYNDGYTYGGSTSIFDSTYLDPLETKSDIEYSMSCPQEVEDNTAAPLFLVLSVEGAWYKLIVR